MSKPKIGKKPEKAKNEVDLNPTITEFVMDGDLSDIDLYADIIKELSEALTAADRQKRKQVMKRFKNKIKTARIRSEKRHANLATLKRRAKNQVIKNYKARMMGGSYANYRKASASQKSAIERMIARRKNAITRATMRMINTKRIQDNNRLQKSSEYFTGDSLMETLNTLYNSL